MIGKMIGIAIIGVLIAYTIHLAFHLDAVHLQTYKHHPGLCRTIEGLRLGAEDFKVLKNGLTFISSGHGHMLRDPAFVKKHNMKGRLYLFNLKKPEEPVIELKVKSSPDFNRDTFGPHGLSVVEDEKKGEHLIYVINHVAGESDRVEKFKYLPGTLELLHMKSFHSDVFRQTNSIITVGEDSFYISNSLYYHDMFMNTLEFVFRLPFGNLVYFDGSSYSVVFSGLRGPNGLAVSRDGRYLYLATSQDKGMMVFERLLDKSLHPIQSFNFGSMVDNLHLSQDGKTLYLGIQPMIWKMITHVSQPEVLAASRVVACPIKDGKIVEEDINELFYDHGDLIAASTVATVYNGRLLIGSLMDKLVLCDMGHSQFEPRN